MTLTTTHMKEFNSISEVIAELSVMKVRETLDPIGMNIIITMSINSLNGIIFKF